MLAETESRVRAAEAEFRVASERLLAAESRNRDPDPADIARQLARFDFERPPSNGGSIGEAAVRDEAQPRDATSGLEPEPAPEPDPVETLREALARSAANRMWDPDEEEAEAEAAVSSVATAPASDPVEATDSDEPARQPSAASEDPSGSPSETTGETADREYGDDETLSVTERELRQYAEQRSEFEERLREFWKDAEGERTAEDDERRFRLWRRERGE
jgi:hypothetical protein